MLVLTVIVFFPPSPVVGAVVFEEDSASASVAAVVEEEVVLGNHSTWYLLKSLGQGGTVTCSTSKVVTNESNFYVSVMHSFTTFLALLRSRYYEIGQIKGRIVCEKLTRATRRVANPKVTMHSCMFCVKYPKRKATAAPATRPSCMILSARR